MHASRIHKYRPFAPVVPRNRTWPDQVIAQPPIWCSVDLRDGNQALVEPMGIEQKLAMFDMLVAIGFKQIEVGFPSASNTEFEFCRRLIETNRIPADVSIQILCQAREPLIIRSLEAVAGARDIIFHLYNSTSPAQRQHTFNMSRDQVLDLASTGVRMIEANRHTVGNARLTLEYSPESFTQTEPDFSLEICEAVKSTWRPGPDRPLILNLPATVEVCTPNQYADLIEWFTQNISDRDSFILSLHTHNDRGTGIAASELGLLAGAQRIEGTLFGNGERTGNLDIGIMSLNMNSQGIATGLDFSNLKGIAEKYVSLTGMEIHPRHPYTGELVFTAFSGGHQDAIKKALQHRAQLPSHLAWEVPYLPIDPLDIGRDYQAIIRINSQSGKGGVVYVLKEFLGIRVPPALQAHIGAMITEYSDKIGTETNVALIWELVKREYVKSAPFISLASFSGETLESDRITVRCQAAILVQNQPLSIEGTGNGPLEAISQGLAGIGLTGFDIDYFQEDAISSGVDASAAAWVCLDWNGQKYWGLGIDQSITTAAIKALFSGLNQAHSG